jgi:hypothetical protein
MEQLLPGRLQVLCLKGGDGVNDALCTLLANQGTKVCSLALSWPGISDTGIVALADGVCRFRRLTLEGLPLAGDLALAGLMVHSRQELRAVTLDGCCRLGEHTMHALASMGPGQLEALAVPRCSGVTAPLLLPVLAQAGAGLRRLDLTSCGEISDSVLRHVTANCSSLRELVVRDCPGVTDAGILAVLQAGLALYTLDVGRCPAITDAVAHALPGAVCGSSLVRLALSGTALTVTGLAALSRDAVVLRNLTELELDDCPAIDERAIRQTAAALRLSLRKLSLRGHVFATRSFCHSLSTLAPGLCVTA